MSADAGAEVPSVAAPTLSTDLFWCHQCKAEIHATVPDYTCPTCSGGFIEPVSENHRTGTGRLAGGRDFGSSMDFEMDSYGDDDYEDDDDDEDVAGAQMAYADFSRILRTLIRGIPLEYEDDPTVAAGNRRRDRNRAPPATGTSPPTTETPAAEPDNDAAAAQQQQQQQQQEQGDGAASTRQRSNRQRANRRRRRGQGAGFLPLEDILEQMFTNSLGGSFGATAQHQPFGVGGGGGGGGGMFIAGNPGDYAFGPRGLDDIITQLLNQYEGGGVAPAKEDEIATLPSEKITEKEVAATAQCPVCFDEYELGQEVKRLACRHAFHEDCIVPWLKIHGTCPVCRSDLQGQAPASPTPKPDESNPASNAQSTFFSADPEAPGTSGLQSSRPPQALPRSQRALNSSNPNTFSFRAAFRPNLYLGPNAGGGVRGNRGATGGSQNRTTSSTNSNSTTSRTNSTNNRPPGGGGGGGGASGGGASSGSSYLDQVD